VGESPLHGEPLLSVREVALQLGVCSATVYELCAKGCLPHVRVLNAIRVAPGELERFIESWRQRQS
jgi:excisionase family DNA binding protein